MTSFALTTFVGAFLLFQIQPLSAKYILPWFGGGPGVWTACMLFFQIALLGGYIYAHLLSRFFKPRTQAIIHLILVAASFLTLPITPADHWKPVSPESPVLRIVTLLVVSLGLPYFVLSTTGPLMQAWFGVVRPTVSPYRLYALSNLGSLLALLSYPPIFERWLSRSGQATIWGWGLALFGLSVAACAWQLLKAKHPNDGRSDSGENQSTATIAPMTRFFWVLLPACASVLLLAVTNTMCLDVAVVPFLWILPLSLYLLSFILCFDAPRWYSRKWYTLALVGALSALCLVLFAGHRLPLWMQISVYSGALFVCCMVCHGELYRLKPAPSSLTSFYLSIGAGGAVGGLFVAIIAPLIFKSYAELHWGLWLLCVLLVLIHFKPSTETKLNSWRIPSWRFGVMGTVALGITLLAQSRQATADVINHARNFYGVLTVRERFIPDRLVSARALMHGSTMHGVQIMPPQTPLVPAGYYRKGSGVELAFSKFPRQSQRRIGVVGLGIGTLSVYASETDIVRFYEINPEILRMAEKDFTFLSSAKTQVQIVLGDARIMLENESPQEFDLLVLDAFSSDAIPIHLLTREAFALYRRHLKPDGALLANITNRHLDLQPVIEAAADELGFKLIIIDGKPAPGQTRSSDLSWAILTDNSILKSEPSLLAVARKPMAASRRVVWTDDHASLIQVLGSPTQ